MPELFRFYFIDKMLLQFYVRLHTSIKHYVTSFLLACAGSKFPRSGKGASSRDPKANETRGGTKELSTDISALGPLQDPREVYLRPRGSGGGGFTRSIPGDGGADQLRGVPVIERLTTGQDQRSRMKKQWPNMARRIWSSTRQSSTR